LGSLRTGDILLADALFSNYWMIALLVARGRTEGKSESWKNDGTLRKYRD